MIGFLAMLAGLMLLVLVHEFGHWIVARLCGMWTPVFSIGFGPRKASLILGKFWGTEFRLSPIPLGGYVAIPELGDESNAEELAKFYGEEAPRKMRTFPVWQRMLVAVAGVVMNIIFAAVLLFGLYAVKGQPAPQVHSTFVQTVSTSGTTIALNSGLQAKDVIVSIDDIKTIAPLDPQFLTDQLQAHKGKPMVLHVTRNGQPVAITVVPNADGKIGIMIGVNQTMAFKPMALGEAAKRSVVTTGSGLYQITYAVAGMMHLVPNTQGAEPHSIVAIFQVGADAWAAGAVQFITILFSLSLNLAIFNILPIPMLDGGHIMFFTYEAIRGKPLPVKVQNFLKSAFLMLLLMLFLFGIFNDFNHPIR
jgi:membrane-associated protease RseP (regulator of RpoE activity)